MYDNNKVDLQSKPDSAKVMGRLSGNGFSGNNGAVAAGMNIDVFGREVSTVMTPQFSNILLTGTQGSNPNEVATKGYVGNLWNSIGNWQSPVKARQSTPPGTVTSAARYLIGTTPPAGTWAGKANHIANYDSSFALTFIAPSDGMVTYTQDTDFIWFYNGTGWVNMGMATDHNNTLNLNTGDYQHLTSANKTYFDSIPALLAAKLANTGTLNIPSLYAPGTGFVNLENSWNSSITLQGSGARNAVLTSTNSGLTTIGNNGVGIMATWDYTGHLAQQRNFSVGGTTTLAGVVLSSIAASKLLVTSASNVLIASTSTMTDTKLTLLDDITGTKVQVQIDLKLSNKTGAKIVGTTYPAANTEFLNAVDSSVKISAYNGFNLMIIATQTGSSSISNGNATIMNFTNAGNVGIPGSLTINSLAASKILLTNSISAIVTSASALTDAKLTLLDDITGSKVQVQLDTKISKTSSTDQTIASNLIIPTGKTIKMSGLAPSSMVVTDAFGNLTTAPMPIAASTKRTDFFIMYYSVDDGFWTWQQRNGFTATFIALGNQLVLTLSEIVAGDNTLLRFPIGSISTQAPSQGHDLLCEFDSGYIRMTCTNAAGTVINLNTGIPGALITSISGTAWVA